MALNLGAELNSLSVDTRSIEDLKQRALKDPQGAVKDAARQFEALFLQMMLKSMRDAGGAHDGPLDSEQTRTYTSMLDQQLAQVMAKRGTGLADVLARQMSKELGTASAPAEIATEPVEEQPVAVVPAATMPAPTRPPTAEMLGTRAKDFVSRLWPHAAEAARETGIPPPTRPPTAVMLGTRAKDFVSRLWPHAAEAARETGIPPRFILAQAALESGWGKGEIRHANGSTAHNLFGVKAGRRWSGPVVETLTTEYVGGTAQKTNERFRAYGSYAEAFKDYARMLKSQPRYAAVIEGGRDAQGFARGLQQAGYATDPAYADKLVRVINSNLLRQGMTG